MVMVRLDNITLAYGARPLLTEVNLSLEKGERVAIIGRNGEGKSSLLRVVSGEVEPDEGMVVIDSGVKVTKLDQEIPTDLTMTIYELVAGGLSNIGEKLSRYHQLLESTEDPKAFDEMSQLQEELDRLDGWNADQRINEMLTRLELEPTERVDNLSGGWIRRALLAKALVSEPDLILLDEPTNHLDIEMVEWLERTLLTYRGALLFVSHDRAFMDKLATKIVELDRGQLTEYPGSYSAYQKQKAIELYNEELERRAFDKKLAEEEIWIRQGVKARRTRSEGRVKALEKMREERKNRIERQGVATLNHEEARGSGRRVIEADKISYKIGERPLITNFSTVIQRGDRIGIIGPNGAGKSTLIKLLLGELTPDSGRVKLGTQIEVAYFDQLRSDLDLEKSVMENVVEGSDFIEINGKRRHIIGWLQDFMFTPERARSPVNSLSGGERNRLLLAKLFTRPFNLLVMDEPTNDLDIETLELLEELLHNFEGTLLLISHDRQFLDDVVTSTIVFEGDGVLEEYIGGYSDWAKIREERERVALEEARRVRESALKNPPKKESKQGEKRERRGRKLSFNEQRELDQLPSKLEALERELSELTEAVNAPQFYESDHETQAKELARLTELTQQQEQMEERWLELESILEG